MDDGHRWRAERGRWLGRGDPNQYSRYGRDEEWEGRFGPEDYGGGTSRGGVDYERGGFQIRGGTGRGDLERGFGQGRAFRDYGRDEWRREGRGHRGRGPRGYTRSDDRIREDLSDRLTDDPYVDASDIEIAVSGGEITLSGHVEHRSARRRAEDIAESVSGVTHVQNNLRVRQAASTNAGASAMAGMEGSGRDSGKTRR
ncbi:BON domain-containing protein [Azospirillum sp. sgz301742]